MGAWFSDPAPAGIPPAAGLLPHNMNFKPVPSPVPTACQPYQAKEISKDHPTIEHRLGSRCMLYISHGDLTSSQDDVIVNSVGNAFNLSVGLIAPDILREAGTELQTHCSNKWPGGIKDGEIACTPGFSMQCKEIYHFCCPAWVDWEEKSEWEVKKMMRRAFKMAEQSKYHSISFPALASRTLCYPAEVVARMMITAACRFGEEADSVHSVVFVINDDDIWEAFRERIQYEKSLQEEDANNINSDIFALKSLSVEVDDFKRISAQVRNDVGAGCKILEIKRNDNKLLEDAYKKEKRRLTDECARKQHLWHGTKEANINRICREGFKPFYAGRNVGKKLGQATYFAVTANLSTRDAYAAPNCRGEQFLIYANVITGLYAKGSEDLQRPPMLDNKQCQSVTDDVSKPTMFAVFNKSFAYPKYVIKLTKGPELVQQAQAGC